MTEENKDNDLENELIKRYNQFNAYLDKIDDLYAEREKFEKMADHRDPEEITHYLENELKKIDNQLNAYLDKIEDLEVEILKYEREKLVDVKTSERKMKKS